MREDSSVSKEAFMPSLCYQTSKYLKDIQREKQDGIKLEEISQEICGRCESKILQAETYCIERKCYHFDRGDILFSENLMLH